MHMEGIFSKAKRWKCIVLVRPTVFAHSVCSQCLLRVFAHSICSQCLLTVFAKSACSQCLLRVFAHSVCSQCLLRDHVFVKSEALLV